MNRRSSVSERRARPGAAFATVAGLLFAACGGSRPEHPNIVLISIDSLRADHLGCYGYTRPTSPRLDALAAESVVFDHAYSTTTWTLPSHLSLLSGLYPDAHGVVWHDRAINEGVELLSEVLSRAGYRTAAAVSGPYLDRRFGYDQGWEIYDDSELGNGPHRGDLEIANAEVTSVRHHARALALLDQLDEEPFFLFLHYWDVHYDYIPPPPYDQLFDPEYVGPVTGRNVATDASIAPGMDPRDLDHLVALYDGEIRWVDSWLEKLFDELRERGLDRRTMIVVVADHGEEFFEHGEKGHNRNLYDTTLQIPLIVRYPDGRHGGQRVATPGSLVDVAPTIARAAGVAPPAAWSGRDLTPGHSLFSGFRSSERDLFADLQGRHKAILRGSLKLVSTFENGALDPHRILLLDRAVEPAERTNLAAARRRLAAQLFLELRRATDRFANTRQALPPQEVTIDTGFEDQLRALGYLN